MKLNLPQQIGTKRLLLKNHTLNKAEIFKGLASSLTKSHDFEAYLSQKIVFEERDWTAGQFLYKFFMDEWQPFAYSVRDNFANLTGREKELGEIIYTIVEKGLDAPKNAYQFIENGETLDVFKGNTEKGRYYENLFAGSKRTIAGNPCYWHPVSRCQTAFIEYKLSEMGMTEEQIISLMTHCENEREKTEKQAIRSMPKQFVHNSVLPPDELKGNRIDVFPRTENDFLNLQNFVFIGPPDTFHAGLPIQSIPDFCMWPRFKSDTYVLLITQDEAKKNICDSYHYYVDMSDKSAFRPCIPLWGGEPLEWVSVKPLHYTSVQKETLQDLIKQGKTIYFVQSKEDWKKYMEKACNMTADEGRAYVKNLATQYPDKVVKLDEKFLSEYEKSFSEYETERKKKRHERIAKISLGTKNEKQMSIKKKLKDSSEELRFDYILPDTHKPLTITGSSAFIKDVCEMMDLMVHSPTALKIFNHNANLPRPLIVEEFKDALDLGRNTGTHIQMAYGKTKDGEDVSKYRMISLLPHEMRHSYNMPKPKSHFLHAISYGITNELDAQAIECVVSLEVEQYLDSHKENYPNAEQIKQELYKDPKMGYFKELYDKAKGSDEDKKREAVEQYALGTGQQMLHMGEDYKSFSELAYKVSIERDTTANQGWIRMSDADFDKLEACLLGKTKPEDVANEPWMQGRENIRDERSVIKKEWPTFCKRLMDGTYRTDVLPYFKDVKPADLIQMISPKLAKHLKEVGVIPSTQGLKRQTPTHE